MADEPEQQPEEQAAPQAVPLLMLETDGRITFTPASGGRLLVVLVPGTPHQVRTNGPTYAARGLLLEVVEQLKP